MITALLAPASLLLLSLLRPRRSKSSYLIACDESVMDVADPRLQR